MIPTVNVTVAVHEQDGSPVRDALVLAKLTAVERYNGYVVADEYGTLMPDFGKNGQARMRLMDEWGTAVQVVPGGRRVFYAKPIGSTGRSAVYELFGNTDAPSIATWRSKTFTFPTPVNMSAAIVECDTTQSEGTCGDIVFWGGPVGEQMVGEVPFGEEDSDAYPGGQPISAVLRVFADGVLRANVLVRPNRFMRLPQG